MRNATPWLVAALLWGTCIYFIVWFEDPRICKRADAQMQIVLACQALPNCRSDVADMRTVVRLRERCEAYKK